MPKKKATGYHSRPGGHDPVSGKSPASPEAARITKGVRYIVTANTHPADYRFVADGVEVNDSGTWITKKSPSTFYPDSCSQQQVVNSIRYAFTHTTFVKFNVNQTTKLKSYEFNGPSAPVTGNKAAYCLGNGQLFTIAGYLRYNGKNWIIPTAFPLSIF